MRKVGFILFGIGLIALAFAIWQLSHRIGPSKHSTQEVEVVMDRMRTVSKLVTAEGYFSEVYDYKDYHHMDNPFLRKKALIRVKARASVGYDLEKAEIEVDSAVRAITIRKLPPVELISIDHELDYYDISEGVFNSFDAEDYTELNRNAKNFISNVAMNSDLTGMAGQKRDELIDLMTYVASASGWELIVHEAIITDLPD